MGKTTYKLGQLVYCSGGVLNRGELIQGYGNIISITDRKTKELYSEKEVVTGYGDKNTRVDIEVNLISEIVKDLWDVSSPISLRENPVRVMCDPHNVIPIKVNDIESSYKKALDQMNTNIEFIKKYSVTRDDKIEIILNGD
jgi:hypothetical protein